MNPQFLIRPSQLNQAFEANNSSGSGETSGVTRRSFIKRTGGATVATLVAWNLTVIQARATGAGVSGSKFSVMGGFDEN